MPRPIVNKTEEEKRAARRNARNKYYHSNKKLATEQSKFQYSELKKVVEWFSDWIVNHFNVCESKGKRTCNRVLRSIKGIKQVWVPDDPHDVLYLHVTTKQQFETIQTFTELWQDEFKYPLELPVPYLIDEQLIPDHVLNEMYVLLAYDVSRDVLSTDWNNVRTLLRLYGALPTTDIVSILVKKYGHCKLYSHNIHFAISTCIRIQVCEFQGKTFKVELVSENNE